MHLICWVKITPARIPNTNSHGAAATGCHFSDWKIKISPQLFIGKICIHVLKPREAEKEKFYFKKQMFITDRDYENQAVFAAVWLSSTLYWRPRLKMVRPRIRGRLIAIFCCFASRIYALSCVRPAWQLRFFFVHCSTPHILDNIQILVRQGPI